MDSDDDTLPPSADGQEIGFPKSSLHKLLSTILPAESGYSTTPRTFAFISQCALEFTHLIAAQANECAEKKGKNAIGGEHVIEAMQELGFENYLKLVKEEYEKHKEYTKVIRRIYSFQWL